MQGPSGDFCLSTVICMVNESGFANKCMRCACQHMQLNKACRRCCYLQRMDTVPAREYCNYRPRYVGVHIRLCRWRGCDAASAMIVELRRKGDRYFVRLQMRREGTGACLTLHVTRQSRRYLQGSASHMRNLGKRLLCT
jgi:hypothetical protein